MLLKTETGHTILADDRDGEELLRIIDRAGQILTMEGKVKPEMQSGNALRRGTKDAEKGDQLDIASQIVGSARPHPTHRPLPPVGRSSKPGKTRRRFTSSRATRAGPAGRKS